MQMAAFSSPAILGSGGGFALDPDSPSFKEQVRIDLPGKFVAGALDPAHGAKNRASQCRTSAKSASLRGAAMDSAEPGFKEQVSHNRACGAKNRAFHVPQCRKSGKNASFTMDSVPPSMKPNKTTTGAHNPAHGAKNRASHRTHAPQCRKAGKNAGGPSHNRWTKRAWWKIFGGAASFGSVSAVGLSSFFPDFGNSENGGGLNGGSGGGGENGGDGGQNRTMNPYNMKKDEDEEGEKQKPRRAFASISSSTTNMKKTDTEEVSDGENRVGMYKEEEYNHISEDGHKLNTSIESALGDTKKSSIEEGVAGQYKTSRVTGLEEDGGKTVHRYKGKAHSDFATNNVKVEVKPDEHGISSPKVPDGQAAQYEEDNWLVGVIESVLARVGIKGRKMREIERRELAKEVASSLVQQLSSSDILAKKSETGALKRLQREAFADIMKLRDRLAKLETSVPDTKRDQEKTRLKAEVSAGGGFVLLNDQSNHVSRAALEQAGLPAALAVHFTFETPFRKRDMLTTKCIAGDGKFDSNSLGGMVRLEKISYTAEVTKDIKFSFVPMGAEAKDVTEIVNPVQDDALTRFSRSGPALFSNSNGSALGVIYKSLNTLVSISEHLSGWGDANGPLCVNTLAQIIHQPLENFVFSIAGLNRVWPSPPLPSAAVLHWSEMRPFVFSRSSSTSDTVRTSAESSGWSTEAPSSYEAKGTSMQALAVSGELDLGGFASLGGWLQVERGDWLVEEEKKRLQWCMSLSHNAGIFVGGISFGRSRRDYWSTLKADEITQDAQSQVQVEAFCKFDCGQGFSLTPGLIYLLNNHCQTPGLMVKAEWKL